MTERKDPVDASRTPETEPSEVAAAPYNGQPDDLHDLFATPSDFDESDEQDPLAQLRNDPNYSALIRELEYIAKQARALFEPAQEAPSDAVWDKIQSQLPTKPQG